MKITCLLGSPRANGNSATIAKRFCDAAEKLGAQIQTFSLNKLNYKGCQACMACKGKLDKCAVHDDLAQVLDSVRETDVLVLAAPTYYGDISAQAKAFIDRTYSFLVPDFPNAAKPSRLAPGKKFVFIQTQRQADETKFADLYPRYRFIFKWYGFKDLHFIRACGVGNAEDVQRRDDVLKLAEETAKKIMS